MAYIYCKSARTISLKLRWTYNNHIIYFLHCAWMGLDRWCTCIRGRFHIQVKPNHIYKVGNDFKKYFDKHFLFELSANAGQPNCPILLHSGSSAGLCYPTTRKLLIKIFFKVISHLIYMVWLDLDVEPAPDTGTPSVKAHSSIVYWVL